MDLEPLVIEKRRNFSWAELARDCYEKFYWRQSQMSFEVENPITCERTLSDSVARRILIRLWSV